MNRPLILLLLCPLFLMACGGGSASEIGAGSVMVSAQARDCDNELTVGGDFCTNRKALGQTPPDTPTDASAPVSVATASNL